MPTVRTEGLLYGSKLKISTGNVTPGVIDSLMVKPDATPRYRSPPKLRTDIRAEVGVSDNEHLSSSESESSEEMKDSRRRWTSARQRKDGSQSTSEPQNKVRPSPNDAATEATPDPTTSPQSPSEKASPAPSPIPPISSIDDIIARHTVAMTNAESAARAKARQEIRQTTPSSSPAVPVQQRFRPVVPVRTSSSPGALVGVVPPRSSSRTSLNDLARTTTNSSSEHESVAHAMRMADALLDQLDKNSMRSGASSTPSSAKRVSFQPLSPSADSHVRSSTLQSRHRAPRNPKSMKWRSTSAPHT